MWLTKELSKYTFWVFWTIESKRRKAKSRQRHQEDKLCDFSKIQGLFVSLVMKTCGWVFLDCWDKGECDVSGLSNARSLNSLDFKNSPFPYTTTLHSGTQ